MADDMSEMDGRLYGGWRAPINEWSAAPGSIHNDETARKVGMRGGTIPGTVHLNLFAPLVLKLFGRQWFEKGTISMFYTYATTDREEVRAITSIPPKDEEDVLVDAWVQAKNGEHTVAKGTVSMGYPRKPSYLHAQDMVDANPNALRILKGLRSGMALPEKEVLISAEEAANRAANNTDPLDWYTGESPWGGPILSISAAYGALILVPALPSAQDKGSVGFFGATEIRYINGPIKTDVPYIAHGHVICVGTSAKTEFYWYDAYLDEKETGKPVASMRKLIRKMKAGSLLYK